MIVFYNCLNPCAWITAHTNLQIHLKTYIYFYIFFCKATKYPEYFHGCVVPTSKSPSDQMKIFVIIWFTFTRTCSWCENAWSRSFLSVSKVWNSLWKYVFVILFHDKGTSFTSSSHSNLLNPSINPSRGN